MKTPSSNTYCTPMEISVPNHRISPVEPFKNLIPHPSIQFNPPLYRPRYKPPPPPIRISQPHKSNGKPILSTTSDVLRLMDSLKLPIPSDVYVSLIKECTGLRDPAGAVELHRHIRRSGIRLGLPLLNRILLMYVSSGCFERARQLFDEMFVRDFNSWAAMIAGCVENGHYGEALKLFVKMLSEANVKSFVDRQDSVAGILICVLKACLYESYYVVGTQVHGWLWKMGFSESVALSSFLISFYGKFKHFEGAESVFEQLGCRNTAVWTTRIVNYCIDDDFKGAIEVFKEMGKVGVRKNGYTFSAVLKACRRIGDVRCSQQIHANVMKSGLESDDYVQYGLVDLYGKQGHLDDATKVFEISRLKRNSACCNAMVMNFVQHGRCAEAVRTLEEMKVAGLAARESVIDELRTILFYVGSRSLCLSGMHQLHGQMTLWLCGWSSCPEANHGSI